MPWNYTGPLFLKGIASPKYSRSQEQVGRERVRGRGCTHQRLPGPTGSQVLCSITWEATWLASVLCWQGSLLHCASRTTCKPGVLMATLIKNQTGNFQTIAIESQYIKRIAHSVCLPHYIPGPNTLKKLWFNRWPEPGKLYLEKSRPQGAPCLNERWVRWQLMASGLIWHSNHVSNAFVSLVAVPGSCNMAGWWCLQWPFLRKQSQ